METTGLIKKYRMAFVAAGFMITFAVTAIQGVKTADTLVSVSYSESVRVSCFKGNPDDGTYVGDITVPDPENAGRICNSLYGDCRGNCNGCFSDSDIMEDVCYDETGKKFLK
ncbi:MAG TPA: hypothetical protein VFG19_06795 [Geobacteraceae bacterium]|nr:hypothetical protein [Geobacteraceae bacterium]